MCLEHFKIAHIGLPVLDDPTMIARHHPVVVMRPVHSANGRVMGLRVMDNNNMVKKKRVCISPPVQA